MDQNVIEIEIRGERFRFYAERAAFQVSTRTLLVSDLHWGKAEVFQKHGHAVPSFVLDDDLARLSRLIDETETKRVLVLGDLIHAPSGITKEVTEKIVAFRARHPAVEMILIPGNHDRIKSLPPDWKIAMGPAAVIERPFRFVHDAPKGVLQGTSGNTNDLFTWSGHEHPQIRLKNATDSVRLPCFVVTATAALLPAFSLFTGGVNVRPQKNQRVFAIAETKVIEL